MLAPEPAVGRHGDDERAPRGRPRAAARPAPARRRAGARSRRWRTAGRSARPRRAAPRSTPSRTPSRPRRWQNSTACAREVHALGGPEAAELHHVAAGAAAGVEDARRAPADRPGGSAPRSRAGASGTTSGGPPCRSAPGRSSPPWDAASLARTPAAAVPVHGAASPAPRRSAEYPRPPPPPWRSARRIATRLPFTAPDTRASTQRLGRDHRAGRRARRGAPRQPPRAPRRGRWPGARAPDAGRGGASTRCCRWSWSARGCCPGRTLSSSDGLWSVPPWTRIKPADVRPLGANFELADAVAVFQPFFQYTRAVAARRAALEPPPDGRAAVPGRRAVGGVLALQLRRPSCCRSGSRWP